MPMHVGSLHLFEPPAGYKGNFFAAVRNMIGSRLVPVFEHGVGLNITLMSYAGNLCLGFVVARCAVPDGRQLADDFLDAFDEMKQHMQNPTKAPRKASAAKPVATQAKAARARATR